MLDKTYSPADIEPRIHAAWEKAKAFKAGRPDMTAAERAKAEPYCIVIPPPNVTGSLHMGHALNNTIQDVLCRFERMRGKDVLWQPGTDHAGIATQLVVSRQLEERQIDWRSEGREKFLEKVWEWKAQSGGTIVGQLKRLGASCDWSRERFTMGDRGEAGEQMVSAVLKVFVELANTPGPTPGRNLIYRDKRLVNWDPEFQSAVSDLEVEPREHTGSFKWARGQVDKDGNEVAFNAAALNKVLDRDPSGHMYYIRYPLAGVTYDANDPKTYLVVATTRPETMLGDTGVAIHPENTRLERFFDKSCVLPLVGREIPIVRDTYADPEKGTGAVKITPAHDFNDWEVGKRCGLRVINILDATAHLNENAPEAYRGMDRFAARKRIVEDLHALDVLDKIEVTTHTVPHAQRGDAIVEPWLTDQWYVDAATLAKPAIEAVRTGKTRFVPERYADDYFRWLENIQPWCISRQLWWGHQIPAWYGFKRRESDPTQLALIGFDPENQTQSTTDVPTDQKVIVALTEQQARAEFREYYLGRDVVVVGSAREALDRFPQRCIWRDPDVLDTWFSSGLWPFSTLGWPEKTPELARYYPTSCLVTGFDIIFFWVARMMMQGLHLRGEVPFRDVYIHGLVLDEKGQKMSKTKGNVMDPLELIDVYGADALRFTLAAMTAQGRNVRLSKSRVEGYRNFATKLWNATRFAEMNGCLGVTGFAPSSAQQTVNRWLAGETERAARAVTTAIEDYRFNDAAGAVYHFVWDVFCDWYIELIKPILTGSDEAAKAETQGAVAWALDQIAALLHPFMPFVTEELWAKTAGDGKARAKLLALSDWPRLHGLSNAEADAEIGWLIRLVSEVRSVRTEMNVPAGAKVPLVLVGASDETTARALRHGELIQRLARADAITDAATAPKGAAQIVVGETTVCLPLAGVIDLAAEAARLKREIAKNEAEIKKIDAKLANQSFVAKAPPEVVEEQHERRAGHEEAVTKLTAALKRLEAAG